MILSVSHTKNHAGVESAYISHLVKNDIFKPVALPDLMDTEFGGCSLGNRLEDESFNDRSPALDLQLKDTVKPKADWCVRATD